MFPEYDLIKNAQPRKYISTLSLCTGACHSIAKANKIKVVQYIIIHYKIK